MSIWQVTLKYVQESYQARNVLHYRGVNDSDVSWPDIAQAFGIAWAGGLADSYSPGTTFYGINVLEVGPGNVSLDYDLTGGPAPGNGADVPSATQVASIVTLVGALPVKPARGRIYLPSPNREQYNANGTFAVGHTGRVDTWMDQISNLDDTEGASLVLGIYSRVWPDGGGIQFNDAGSYIVRGNPATQRRRRIGTGS